RENLEAADWDIPNDAIAARHGRRLRLCGRRRDILLQNPEVGCRQSGDRIEHRITRCCRSAADVGGRALLAQRVVVPVSEEEKLVPLYRAAEGTAGEALIKTRLLEWDACASSLPTRC